jgi:hypothetical protein
MEIIERIPIREIFYLNTLTFKQYKNIVKSSAKNEDERKANYNILKNFCKTNIKTDGITRRIYTHTLNSPSFDGGRLYCGNSIQNLPKDIRGFLMKHTTDLDFKNCHPVILKYIAYKHKIPCPNLDYYIENRDEILNTFEENGKILFLKAVNDDKINYKVKDPFFKNFDKEMKTLQNIIINLPDYKDIVNSVPSTRNYNWNGSAINRILCYYENKFLQGLISILNKQKIEIAVLMFDGLMIYGNYYSNPTFLDNINKQFNELFPTLNMTITLKDHSTTIIMPDDFQIRDNEIRICNNDKDASLLLWDEKFKNILVYSDGNLFYKHNYKWVQDYKFIESNIRNYVLNSNIYKTNENKETIDYVQNRRNADNITKCIIDICINNKKDDWINNNFSSSLGKILFNNGYYDFKQDKFYLLDDKEFDNSIIFMENIPFDFNSKEKDIEYINSIKERIFCIPLGKNVGEWFILQIARALAGDCMKRFLVGIGPSNTGKSLFNGILRNCIGGYYGAWNAVNLSYKPNSSGDEAQKLRWVKLLPYKRIIVSSELTMGTPIDGNMIKKLSNGGQDDLVARGHGENETSFRIGFLPILFAQDMENIQPMDDAVIHRVKGLRFDKSFVDNPNPENPYELKKDSNLENEIMTYKFKINFLSLLFQSYSDFYKNGMVDNEPVEIITSCKDILGDNLTIIDKFKNDYEITNNEDDYVLSQDIQNWLKVNDTKITIKKFTMELTKYKNIKKLNNVYSKDKKNKEGRTCKAWFGVKKYLENELDTDSENEEHVKHKCFKK